MKRREKIVKAPMKQWQLILLILVELLLAVNFVFSLLIIAGMGMMVINSMNSGDPTGFGPFFGLIVILAIPYVILSGGLTVVIFMAFIKPDLDRRSQVRTTIRSEVTPVDESLIE